MRWVRAVEYRRLHHLDDGLGAAVTVQRMVFGNGGGRKFVEGDVLCRDANGGRVLAGRLQRVVEKPLQYLAEVERWRRASTAGLVA